MPTRTERWSERQRGPDERAAAEALDAESAGQAARLRLDEDVRNGLAQGGDASLSGSARSVRGDEELAALDAENQRRLRFRKRLAARTSFYWMLLIVVVLFVTSATVILRLYGR
ncbi:MAG: hypothetical protein KIS92_03355 [Planctomycetota bacterium]|nr:hypothetical protein [Planctomycetota bacterium]